MNNALMFSKASDEWSTPQAFFDALAEEFMFSLDVAATKENCKCADYFGPDRGDGLTDALKVSWRNALDRIGGTWHSNACWMNPPYSKCREFITKAAYERREGVTTVCLVPSRTDTRWFHEYVWNQARHAPHEGVEVRFIKGRLRFGTGAGAEIRTTERVKGSGVVNNSAPFPSVVIVFRGQR